MSRTHREEEGQMNPFHHELTMSFSSSRTVAAAAAADSPDVVILDPPPGEEDVITISSSSSAASSPSHHRRQQNLNTTTTTLIMEQEILASNNNNNNYYNRTNPSHNMFDQDINYLNDYNNYNNEPNYAVPVVYDLVEFAADEEMAGGGQQEPPFQEEPIVVDGLVFCPNCYLNFTTVTELESHFRLCFNQPYHHHQNTNVVPPNLRSEIVTLQPQQQQPEQNILSELLNRRIVHNQSQEQPVQYLNSSLDSSLDNYSSYQRASPSIAASSPFSTSSSTTTITTTTNLYNHNGIQNETSFSCRFCEKKFAQKRYLNQHLKIHTRPHTCQICFKSFPHNYSLNKHLVHHGKEATLPKPVKIIPPPPVRQNSLEIPPPNLTRPLVETVSMNIIEVIDLSDDDADDDHENKTKKAIIIDKTSCKSCPSCGMTFLRSELPLFDIHIKSCRGPSSSSSAVASFEEISPEIVHHQDQVATGEQEGLKSQLKISESAAAAAESVSCLLRKKLLEKKEKITQSTNLLVQQQQQPCQTENVVKSSLKLCPLIQKDEDSTPCDSKSMDSGGSTESLQSIDLKPIQNNYTFDIKPLSHVLSPLMEKIKEMPRMPLTVKISSEDVKNLSSSKDDDDDKKIKSPVKTKQTASSSSSSNVCKVCGDTFQLNYSLKRHLLTHGKDKKV